MFVCDVEVCLIVGLSSSFSGIACPSCWNVSRRDDPAVQLSISFRARWLHDVMWDLLADILDPLILARWNSSEHDDALRHFLW